MIKLYLDTLTTLLTDIKQGIESDNQMVNNGCLNEIKAIEERFINDNNKFTASNEKHIGIMFRQLWDKIHHYYQDRESTLRRSYVQDAFQQIRSKLMELILFESGLNI